MKYNIKLKPVDVIALNFYVNFRLIFILFYTVLFISTLFYFVNPAHNSCQFIVHFILLSMSSIGIAVSIPIIVTLLLSPVIYLFNKYIAKTFEQTSFSIDNNGFVECSFNKNTLYEWNRIRNILKRDNYIFLQVTSHRWGVIPSRIFKNKHEFELLYSNILSHFEQNQPHNQSMNLTANTEPEENNE